MNLPFLEPNLQISFAARLDEIRCKFLHQSLSDTVKEIDLSILNLQLQQSVSKNLLKKVASFGLRGEVFFPVPCLLEKRPYLLGYYRLLLGFSQKEFFNKGPFSRFKRLEEQGEIPLRIKTEIPVLCKSLSLSSQKLVASIDLLSLGLVHDLQLLTLGPQLRGGHNTRLGQNATMEVFDLLARLVSPYVTEKDSRRIVLRNSSGRIVNIEFGSDPDIRIVEALSSKQRPLVSVEIKGGTDMSNAHNRLGEAEKSHQKAKARGFFEFWTIIRTDLNEDKAREESPTTSYFFNLDRITDSSSSDYELFSDHFCSVLGIRSGRDM